MGDMTLLNIIQLYGVYELLLPALKHVKITDFIRDYLFFTNLKFAQVHFKEVILQISFII